MPAKKRTSKKRTSKNKTAKRAAQRKSTKRRSTKSSSKGGGGRGAQGNGVPGEVERKDFQKVGPEKRLPGPIGRTMWFTERAGRRADALSLKRLTRGITTARSMPTPSERLEDAQDEARTAVADAARDKKGVDFGAPFIIDPNGKRREYKTAGGKSATKGEKRDDAKDGACTLCRTVEIDELRGRGAFLFLPVDKQRAADLDMDDVVVADVSDPMSPHIVETFRYWPEEGVVAGKIHRPGRYQAFAPPKHPWLRTAFETLASHWKWARADAELRSAAGISGSDEIPGFIDRLCLVILCPADVYDNIEDRELFRRFGLGDPPGFRHEGAGGREPGAGPGGNFGRGFGGDICERCLGNFFGELGEPRPAPGGIKIYPIPPLIKWWWLWRFRCRRWRAVGPVPGAGFGGIGRVTQIDIHPSNGNRLIAASCGGGVWGTTNGGSSWRPLMDDEPTLTMGAVAYAPSNPDVMYGASGEDAGGWNPAWGGVGVYRSDNGGASWHLAATLPSERFSAIVVHPADPDTLYVAGDEGLHKSDDGGLTWITNPGQNSLFDAQITDVVIAHDDPSRIYVGVRSDGVYRSTNGGEQIGMSSAFKRLDNPNQLPSGSDAGWIKLAIGRNGSHGSDFVVAKLGPSGSQIFATTNGGNHWTELAQNVAAVSYDEWCSIVAVSPDDEDVLYAGAAGALKRTTNGGANPGDWTSIYSGVHADQQDLAFDPTDSDRIFLANDGGVYRSSNQGNSWTFASGNLQITQLYDIDISEKDRDVIAGGAQDNGVYYRNTSGVWTHIPWGDGTQIAVDPTDPDIFYFSSQNGLPNWLRRSVNGGASHQPLGTSGLSGSSPWITIIKLDPTDPLANPANNRIVFVCGHNQLFRSTNGGSTWQRVEDGSGDPFTTYGTITALEFALGDPSILYLGTSLGAVYRAINGGADAADWTRIDTVGTSADALFPDVQIQSLRVHAMDANNVWVVFGGSGVSFTGRPDMILNPLGISHLFRTVDGGANWVDASGIFASMSLPDVPTSAVALDDVSDDVAYAGTDVGVFRTTDGGDTWTAFQDGLPRSPVVELRFNRYWNRLFAGTMGRGAFYRDV